MKWVVKEQDGKFVRVTDKKRKLFESVSKLTSATRFYDRDEAGMMAMECGGRTVQLKKKDTRSSASKLVGVAVKAQVAVENRHEERAEKLAKILGKTSFGHEHISGEAKEALAREFATLEELVTKKNKKSIEQAYWLVRMVADALENDYGLAKTLVGVAPSQLRELAKMIGDWGFPGQSAEIMVLAHDEDGE